MTQAIRVERDVPMTTRDGVTLRSDIFRPDDSGKYPAILIRSPYNKLMTPHNDVWRGVDFAFRGYALIIQDCRGRFASEGEYGQPGLEGPDGHDAVEWAAGQPWCNSRVAMCGGSYLAATQWQAAVQRPPSLTAMAPSIMSAGLLGPWFTGGAFHLDLAVSWISLFGQDLLAKLENQGKVTPEMRASLYWAAFNPEELSLHLPLKEIKLLLPGLPDNLFAALEVPSPDAPIWRAFPREWDWGNVLVPALHQGGWYDLYTGDTIRCWESMRQKGGSAQARAGQHLLMGPWPHGLSFNEMVGGIHFGINARGSLGQIAAYYLNFFDKYVKGMDIDLPVVRYFVMTENQWHNASSWPLPETEWQRYYLHSEGKAQGSSGDGRLSRESPGVEPADLFVYDPRFPVPTTGGRNLRMLYGPQDQCHIEKRSDVLVYSTPPLEKELEVTGPLCVHLFASTSAPDTDFTAKLVDVYPDGRCFNVAEGIIRARFWKSYDLPDLITPGEVREYIIDLAATGNLFQKGHRIRLDITSSNFPRFDRNMNTGNPIGTDKVGVPAVQTILHENGQASYIDLPVIPRRRY